MLRANLTQIFIVDNSYRTKVDYFKDFNHSLVTLTDEELIFEKDNTRVKFELEFHEKDYFTKTLLSQFEDGTPFRVIQPIGITKEISFLENNYKDGFTVGSINPDGYSVTFMLTEKNDIRNIKILVKGVEEHLQKLITGAIMALQHNLHNDFYNISRRLIASINANNKNIHDFDQGTQIAQILKANSKNYDEIEQRIIDRL